MIKKIAFAAAFAVLASSAYAAPDRGVYVGGDVGTSKQSDVDGRETSAGGFVGYKFNQNFSVEGGYRRLYDGDDRSFDQASVSGIGTIPLNNGFSVYGRLGVNRLNAELEFPGENLKDHETKVLYGVGLGYAFTPTISGRLEVQKPRSDITNLSAGVAFQF